MIDINTITDPKQIKLNELTPQEITIIDARLPGIIKQLREKFYQIEPLDLMQATYNIIIGQRSNGKTFAVCRKIVDQYIETGIASAYIRRFDETLKTKNIETLFDPHIVYVEKMTGKWNKVIYRNYAFYFGVEQDGKIIKRDSKPFCRCYSLNSGETTNGADRGEVKYILFDEFVTRKFYLQNEFILLQNKLSTIIRSRENVIIYMVANTVNKYCPYFKEMGLHRVAKQPKGTIDLYTMGKTHTKIAVEYCEKAGISQESEHYFCFDNPEINMITSGDWEISLYRHIKKGFSELPSELTFFIYFDDNIIKGDIKIVNDAPIICFEPKTTAIKDPENTIIYFDETDDPNPLHQTEIKYTGTRAHEIILTLIRQHKTYFATNECGEMFANWLKKSGKGVYTV